MKRLPLILALIVLFSGIQYVQAQSSLTESAMKKVTIGLDIFTDVWVNAPTNVDIRAINPSANTYLTYNFVVGNSKNLTFGIGVGVGNHNMYSNDGVIENIKADTIRYVPVDSDVDMKRSKLSVTYLEFPMELRFKSPKGFKISLGFKLGYLIDSKEKYVGNTTAYESTQVIKRKRISQVNTFSYSPTFRLGYKSFNLFFSYSLGTVFRVDHGPQLHPMSIGITLTPF
ncbi:PorT family protein [Candidatus Sulfidibacterium hydrothermale]|uniref:porin family protein n=1 Tax=Candidatus Sulfidibacterium hydrothermale TaxID=2875962 RepID=UPI001F0B0C3D|nr:porin family protein [Candidatus Sulfidibacterium hydrothermale]UBM62881.1 PorT family protein [Candidatus Sulfidibacterium hydrothermale]